MKSLCRVRAGALCLFSIWCRWTVLPALLLVGVAESNTVVQAQDSTEITALFGRGVHAYFAGQTSQADEMFSDCILAGSSDPRVYYFRGVSRLRQGRQSEAEEDLKVGAMYEARDPGLRFGIGNAMQRIQGPERITLEEFRRQARMEKVQQRRTQTRERYEQLHSREADVLHRSQPVPLEQLVEPSVEFQRAGQIPADQPAAPVTTPPLTAEPAPMVTPTPVVEPAPVVEQPAAEDDWFGTPVEPTIETPVVEAPSVQPLPVPNDDPFGTGPVAEPVPAENPATSADIVGDPALGPATDPGPAPDVAVPIEAAPAEGVGPAVEADPFGETEAAPAEAAPAVAVPIEAAPAESAEPAVEADPFGETAVSPTEEAPADIIPSEEAPASEAEPVLEEDPFGAAETAPAEEGTAEEAPTEEAPAEEGPAEEGPAEEAAVETTEESTEADPFGAEAVESEAEEATDTVDDSANEGSVVEEPAESTESTEDPFGASDEVEAEDEQTDTEESEEVTDEASEEVDAADDADDAPADEPAADEDPFGGF